MKIVTDNKKYLNWFIGAAVAAAILIFILMQKQCSDIRETQTTENLQNALNDTIKLWKDKDGYNRGKILVLEAHNAGAFLLLSSKDTTIRKLQKLVAFHKNQISSQGSISVINTEGTVDMDMPTIVEVDTITDDTAYLANFNFGGWVWGSIRAQRDSIGLSLKYKDEFNLVIGREKKGFLGLGRGRAYADLTSKSPFTEIKEMRVYQTALPRNKNFHIGPGIFYGIGTELKAQPFVGVGLMWTPINF